jgi:hypothetical protein
MLSWFKSLFTTQPKYKIGDRFEPRYPSKYAHPIKLVAVGEDYVYESKGLCGGGRISEVHLEKNYRLVV